MKSFRYIEIRIIEDDNYKREGNDIYLEVPVTITDLCLGTTKTIKTIDKAVSTLYPFTLLKINLIVFLFQLNLFYLLLKYKVFCFL